LCASAGGAWASSGRLRPPAAATQRFRQAATSIPAALVPIRKYQKISEIVWWKENFFTFAPPK